MPIKTAPSGRRQLLGRLNQTYALLNTICNANSCDLFELDGELDLVLLKRAVGHVIDRHPMARSVFVKRGPFFDWIHTDQRLPFEIETRRIDSDDPTEIRHALLSAAWERNVLTDDRHPFRLIYTATPSGFYLQIITSHVYTDGKAAGIFTADVAECYAALERGEAWNPPPADIPNRNHDRMFLKGIPISRRIKLFAQGLKGLLTDLLMPAGRLAITTPRTPATDVLMMELPDALSLGLRRTASQSGLTLHPFMLVAVLRACEKFNQKRGKSVRWPLRIVDNFSLRRFSSDPAIAHIYDCVAVPYTLTPNPECSDDELLQSLYETLEDLKQGDALRELYRLRFYYWLSLPLPKALAIKIACYLCTRADVICTNVGVLDSRLEQIGSVKVRSYFSFPQLFPPGKVMYQISSFRGKMRLALLYDRGQLTEAQARSEFADAFIDSLNNLIGQAANATPDTSIFFA